MLGRIAFYLFMILLVSCSVDEPSTGTYDVLRYRAKTPSITDVTLNFEDADCVMYDGDEVCSSGSLIFFSDGTYQSDIQIMVVDDSLIYVDFIQNGTFEEIEVGKVLCNNERICTLVNLKKDKITLVYPTLINDVEGTIEIDLILN